jgi:Protein DA1
MNWRWTIVWLMLAWLARPSRAAETVCDICGQPIVGKFYQLEDRAMGGKKNICRDCAELDERCFACGLPVKKDYKTLPDGRYLCARDAKDAIESEEEMRQICETVRDDINHVLWRFLTLPTNVTVASVDKFQLQNLFKSPGYEQACVSIFGAAQSFPLPGGKFVHSISILSHLKKSRLMAVCAHEYTHTWLNENVKAERRSVLDSRAVEGFCELMAYKYMESKEEPFEMEVIKTSDYTKGQISLMLEADRVFGFNTVLDWMRAGEDAKLNSQDLNRIRAVRGGFTSQPGGASPGLLIVPPPAPPPPGPDRLVLKGISVVGQRRLAIINDHTFETMERGKVRIGVTNALIRCLEIRRDSVLVQTQAGQKEELFLREQ